MFIDWGNTFGKKDKRKICMHDTCENCIKHAIYPDALEYIPKIHHILKQRGGGIGLISNTSYNEGELNNVLYNIGLGYYLHPKVYSSSLGIKNQILIYFYMQNR